MGNWANTPFKKNLLFSFTLKYKNYFSFCHIREKKKKKKEFTHHLSSLLPQFLFLSPPLSHLSSFKLYL